MFLSIGGFQIMSEKWMKHIEALKLKYPVVTHKHWKEKNYVNPYCFIEYLSECIYKDAIVIPDTGATLCWTMQAIKPKLGQTIFTQWNMASMGYSLCAGIGAYYAAPGRQIVCLIGDGGMQMNIQELETISHLKIPLKIFIFNNKEYGIINQTFKTWGMDKVASEPENGLGFPDFIKVAKAYGIKTEQINNNNELVKIRTILCKEGPVVTVLNIRKGQEISPKLKAGQRLEEME